MHNGDLESARMIANAEERDPRARVIMIVGLMQVAAIERAIETGFDKLARYHANAVRDAGEEIAKAIRVSKE